MTYALSLLLELLQAAKRLPAAAAAAGRLPTSLWTAVVSAMLMMCVAPALRWADERAEIAAHNRGSGRLPAAAAAAAVADAAAAAADAAASPKPSAGGSTELGKGFSTKRLLEGWFQPPVQPTPSSQLVRRPVGKVVFSRPTLQRT